MPRHKILISGAGIAGPTTAYWLLKHGFEPVLIERAPHLRQGGYIIDFWGVGFDVAEQMGLVPTLRSLGYRMRKIEFVARDGHTRSSFGGNLFERALGDRFVSIHRGDLANAIYATIQNDVETIFGDSISGLNQTPDGVEVTFEVGRPRCFDLVIGADGLHSPVRTLAFDLPGTEHYLGYYAASFLTSGYSRRNENTYLSYAAPGRQISRYALRDDRTGFLFVFASEHKIPEVAHDIEAQKQVLRRTFSLEPWIEWPEIERHMDMCDDLYFDAVSQITIPCWSQGRTVLVGDAAYCPSLLAGEGAAFAMGGGYILAGELRRGGGVHASAFAAYENCYRPFIERKQESARGFASSFAPKSSFGLFLRDQVLRLGAISAIGNFLMRRFVTDAFNVPDYSPLAAARHD